MDNQSSFHVGFAEVDFTPPPGLPLLGQMTQRIATGTRDPLLACAMAMRQGETTVVQVVADVALLELPFVDSVQREWAGRSGLPASHLLLHATHTHDAPATTSRLMEETDPAFQESLSAAILESAQLALDNLEPVELFAGCGQLENMGWNRRAMFDDGTSRMYGHSQLDGFIGMEGPRDPALPVLFTRNAQGKISGVMVSFATHPNSIESASVYSADVPGAVRRHLKKLFGECVTIIYLTGAAGNTAPSILDPYDELQPWRGEDGLERSGLYLAGETAKVIASTIHPIAEPILKLQRTVLQIPLREWPQPDDPAFPRSPGNPYYEKAAREWPQHLQTCNPVETRINVLRIGDAVLCTNPAELFVEFGLEIREASPARVTFTSTLSDGYVGYVPTELAFSRGGYETWCAPSSQLHRTAGAQIVAATHELLTEMF